MRASVAAGLAVVVCATSVAVASAWATVADDLCAPAADPCVVAGDVTVDPGSTLDFGSRTLQLAAGAVASWTGDLHVIASQCDFQEGSALRESVAGPTFSYLNLDCGVANLAGAIVTKGSGVIVTGDGPHVLSGSITAKGDQVGVIAVDSYGTPGDITVSGKINAQSRTGTPPGEFRLNTSFGNITVTEDAKIVARGATADPFSEFFSFIAGSGTLTVDGSIDARAKNGAYAFNFEANQAVTFGPRSQIKATARTRGAEMAINSQLATVTLRGKIKAAAKNAPNPDGPKVHVCAGNDIVMEEKAKIDASDGSQGSVILGAYDIARVQAGATIFSKADGDIEVCGGTSGSISSDARVFPGPEAVGTWDTAYCLSPESQVIFELDCNGAPP
jgi:hypothetical protein